MVLWLLRGPAWLGAISVLTRPREAGGQSRQQAAIRKKGSSMQTITEVGQVTMYPLLRYGDPEQAFAWLARVFGLRAQTIDRDDAGAVVHAELTLGDGVVMISPESADGPVCGRQELYIALDDVDALYERVTAAGAEIVRPLADQDYGSRDFAARDLEGNTWYFGTYRATIK